MSPNNFFAGNKLVKTKSKSNSFSLISPSTYIDDDSYNVGDTGFNFPFYGTNYRLNIFVGTNSYITFGFGSNSYSALSSSNPGKGILIAAGDNGIFGGIFTYSDIPKGKFIIRFLGTNRGPYQQNISWETILYSNGNIGINTFAITPRTEAISMITKGDGIKLTSFSNNSNQNLLYGYSPATDNYILV